MSRSLYMTSTELEIFKAAVALTVAWMQNNPNSSNPGSVGASITSQLVAYARRQASGEVPEQHANPG